MAPMMMETGVILPDRRDNDCASHTDNSFALALKGSQVLAIECGKPEDSFHQYSLSQMIENGPAIEDTYDYGKSTKAPGGTT